MYVFFLALPKHRLKCFIDPTTEPFCKFLPSDSKFTQRIEIVHRRDAVATDIVHQHSGRLDYYKGCHIPSFPSSISSHPDISRHRNFTQFYSTKSERERNLQREYDAQMDYRKHLQAFIDRWRYNANRGASNLPFHSRSKVGLTMEKIYSGTGTVEDQNPGEGIAVLCKAAS